ncbi:CRAL-TRIO domain-containing protein [Phascolomyces articulosus]|uniref:CRAL-TRIO domain-containing protein n=1 Tax=Phascolomyces articulosus TaxID=60185 RepID=A0AAD5KBE7_9FUNG|nr:CRAL-TRIO domain-containing protein [Phascolomyces articulosus]
MNFFIRTKLRSNSLHSDTSNSHHYNEAGPVTFDPLLDLPYNYFPSIKYPPLNEPQRAMLEKLRDYISSIMLNYDHEYYPNEKGFLTDATLRRHLTARKWDYESSKTTLESTIRWRRDYRPDQIDIEYIKPKAETGKMYFNGFDKQGRPIWIIRPRCQNSKDEDRQTKHIIFCLERGICLMPPSLDTIAIIVDFKDAACANSPSIATCKRFLNILGNHYPERLGVAFVVNAPWFFFATFKMISPFMEPETKSKIKFAHPHNNDKDDKNQGEKNTKDQQEHGEEGQKEDTVNNVEWVHLKHYISLDMLETELGGSHHFSFDVEHYFSLLLSRTGTPHLTR